MFDVASCEQRYLNYYFDLKKLDLLMKIEFFFRNRFPHGYAFPFLYSSFQAFRNVLIVAQVE